MAQMVTFSPPKRWKSQFTAFLSFAAEEGQLRRMKGVDTVLKKAAAAWTSAWVIVLKEKTIAPETPGG